MANTYEPICSEEPLNNWNPLQKLPKPEPGLALVFSGERQPLVAFTQGQGGLTRSEMFWGTYNLVYKVDLAEHPLEFTFEIPCKGDAYDFNAVVNFICSVREPIKIVERKVKDVNKFLQPLIGKALRDISRQYEIEEIADAENSMNSEVSRQVYHQGFNIRDLVIALALPEEVRTSIQKKREIKNRREDEGDELKHNLEMTRKKMDFYVKMFQGGHLQLLALQLAENPKDMNIIVQYLNEQKPENKARLIRDLQQLGDVEDIIIQEAIASIIYNVIGGTESSTRRLGGGKNDNQKNSDYDLDEEDTYNSGKSRERPKFDYDNDGQ